MTAPATAMTQQIGTSGLRQVGGRVYEEFVPELQPGRYGRARYREMSLNDATIKRGLRALKWDLLRPDWRVEGAEGPKADEADEFLLSCLDDMSDTWREALREALSCLDYGASYCQVLYKQCLGPEQNDPKKRSKFDDGLVRWRKWSFRGQETWDGWSWDEDGDVEGLYQLDQYSPGTGRVLVPLSQSLHFKIEGRLGDPEGESILRSCYKNYCMKREAELFEIIRVERDATGIPVFEVQEGGPNLWDTADVNATALLTYLQKAGTALRMDEQMTVISPAGIKFRLEGSPGTPQVDVDKVIRRHDWQILGSMLAQFLELGQSAHGSFGKSESDQDLFMLALEGILVHVVAETINRFEVPRLFRLNAGTFGGLTKLPYFVPGDLVDSTLGDLAEPLGKLIAAGAITPDPTLEAWLRQKGNLPEMDEEYAAERQAQEDAAAQAAAEAAAAAANGQPPVEPPDVGAGGDGKTKPTGSQSQEGAVGKQRGRRRLFLGQPSRGGHDHYTVHDFHRGE
jgi:hypothetical protein